MPTGTDPRPSVTGTHLFHVHFINYYQLLSIIINYYQLLSILIIIIIITSNNYYIIYLYHIGFFQKILSKYQSTIKVDYVTSIQFKLSQFS